MLARLAQTSRAAALSHTCKNALNARRFAPACTRSYSTPESVPQRSPRKSSGGAAFRDLLGNAAPASSTPPHEIKTSEDRLWDNIFGPIMKAFVAPKASDIEAEQRWQQREEDIVRHLLPPNHVYSGTPPYVSKPYTSLHP